MNVRFGLILLICGVRTLLGQGLDIPGKIHRWIQDTVPEDSSDRRSNYFILVPVVRYLPETRWSGVLAGNFVFRTHPAFTHTRPSSIRLSATYTQNRQFICKPTAEIFFPENRWMIRTGFLYMRFPELYYGIGGSSPADWEEQYSFDMSRFFFRGFKRVGRHIYTGPIYLYEYMYGMKVQDSSVFNRQPVSGRQGGWVSGPGWAVVFDNRNNIYYPSSGWYAEFSGSAFSKFTGSGFNYSAWVADVRAYQSLHKGKAVLAGNVLLHYNPGNPPFRQMGILGGESFGRGYYQGRFRDKHHLVLQSEYRLKVWKRMGMTFFGGLATVFSNHPAGAPWHPFYGFGFRGKLLRKEYLNVRLDIGFRRSGPQYYFTLDEAF
jgi:hypothetical protein